MERIKPKIGDGVASLGHQALALPGEAEPETAIVVLFFAEIDAADELAGIGLQAESPVPGFAALDCRERNVANIEVGGIGGVRAGAPIRPTRVEFAIGREDS